MFSLRKLDINETLDDGEIRVLHFSFAKNARKISVINKMLKKHNIKAWSREKSKLSIITEKAKYKKEPTHDIKEIKVARSSELMYCCNNVCIKGVRIPRVTWPKRKTKTIPISPGT